MNVAGINLYGFRLLIIILAVFSTPLTSRSEWWSNPVARYTVLFMILWTVVGLLSLLWTPDLPGGVTEIMTLIFAIGLILALFNLRCYTPKNIDMLRFGWVFGFVAVIALAAWEIVTGDRLPSYKTEAWDTYVDSSMVQSTLGAPGTFGSYLLLATPFLIWSLEQARGPQKLFYVGLLAAAGFFGLYSGSRNSFFALMLQLVIYFLVLERRWYVRLATVACGLVAAVLWVNVFMHSDFKLAQKYQNAAERGLDDGSITGRMALSMNGIWMAIETAGRGVGADGYEETIASGDVLIPLSVNGRGQEKPAHNVWVEILSEYGVIPFVGLMVLLGWIARLGWQARRGASVGGVNRGAVARVVLVGLVGYAFYGIQSGSVLQHPTNFMFFASLCTMAAFLWDAKTRQQPAGATAAPQQSGIYGAPARSLQLRVSSAARRQPHAQGALVPATGSPTVSTRRGLDRRKTDR
jgi:hypothetical protein